jgi:hypothetical protein
VFPAWGVEIAEDDARARAGTEMLEDGLVRADLGELRLRADRRVDVHDLEWAGSHRQDALRPWDSGDRHDVEGIS